MHIRLEKYLEEVTKRLNSLPPARRNQEIKEIRQHLLNAMVVNREKGLTEDEATAEALMQFGTPEALGEGLLQVWKRDADKQNKIDFWVAASCTFALQHLLFYLLYQAVGHWMRPYEVWPFIIRSMIRAYPLYIYTGVAGHEQASWEFAVFFVMGGVSGFLFPKHAVRATALVIVVLLVSMAPQVRFSVNLTMPEAVMSQWLPAFIADYIPTIIFGLCAVYASWEIGQFREMRARRLQGS